MTARQPEDKAIAPRDVFARSNMPSRWERLTGVRPRTPGDRKFLAFAAARYRGDERLRHPDALLPPTEIAAWERVSLLSRIAGAAAVALVLIGVAGGLVAVAAAGIAIAVGATLWAGLTWHAKGPAIKRFHDERSRCASAQKRLHADPLDEENTRTVDQMILCDEGTLAYCAAKIASEIDKDPAWSDARAGGVFIDVWDEVAEVGESAREIHEDRESMREPEAGRLRDDPDVLEAIAAYRQQVADGIAALAERVHTFADIRDHVHRIGVSQRITSSALNRARRSALEDFARDHPR